MMIGPRTKYQGEQDARYGGDLLWPGNQYGIPFRSDNGQVPLLKKQEYEQLQVTGEFHAAQFDLSNPEHLSNYLWVRDREVNQLFRVNFLQRFWDPAHCRMIIYIEWTQLVSQLPKRTGGPGNGVPVF
jgi:hypothetical protein